MKILSRYVLREFLVPLAYCLAGFVGIYVLFELFGSFSRIMESGMSFRDVAAYFAGYLSPSFHYLVPAALMLATLYTMWNFCRHSELTAMRASGISLGTVVRPLLFAALAMAALVAWVNESYMPARARWAKNLRASRFDASKAGCEAGFTYCNSRDRRIWTVSGSHDIDCSRLEDVRVLVNRGDGTREMSIAAAKAEYMDGEWWFTSAKVQHYDALDRQVASPCPAADALPLRAFPQFRERPGDMAMQNSDAKFSSVAGKLRYLRRNRDLTDEARESMLYDAWAQALSPFACIVITLLSIPAGMISGRQAVFSGVLGAMTLFFAYNGATIACKALVGTGLVPAVPAALMPPLAFLALGVFYCRRTLKATLLLAGAFFLLAAAYVVLAAYLSGRLGIDRAMAHGLAATLPLMAAAFLFLRAR